MTTASIDPAELNQAAQAVLELEEKLARSRGAVGSAQELLRLVQEEHHMLESQYRAAAFRLLRAGGADPAKLSPFMVEEERVAKESAP